MLRSALKQAGRQKPYLPFPSSNMLDRSSATQLSSRVSSRVSLVFILSSSCLSCSLWIASWTSTAVCAFCLSNAHVWAQTPTNPPTHAGTRNRASSQLPPLPLGAEALEAWPSQHTALPRALARPRRACERSPAGLNVRNRFMLDALWLRERAAAEWKLDRMCKCVGMNKVLTSVGVQRRKLLRPLQGAAASCTQPNRSFLHSPSSRYRQKLWLAALRPVTASCHSL